MFGHGKYGNANGIPTFCGFPILALIGMTALSPTERNPSFRNHRIRWSPRNGQAWEAPPSLKYHVMNPTESMVHRSEARALIYGELQVTSRYRSGTPHGIGPVAQKTSRSGNFEFCQLLLVCLGMGNMAMPTASPPSMSFCHVPIPQTGEEDATNTPNNGQPTP